LTHSELTKSSLSQEWTGGEISKRELVGRIVNSPTFTRSERLSSMLHYICEMSLKGRESEINEQKIGQDVFGRPRDYDSTVDGIVRTQASRLRQRLDLYFEQEGSAETIRLSIPRGAYVPVFEQRLPATVPDPPHTALAAHPIAPLPSTARHSPQWLPWALCGLLFVAVCLLALKNRRLAEAANPPAVQHPLWSHVLVKGERTLIVPADSGLVMYHNLSGREVTLNDYLQGSYRDSKPPAAGLGPDSPLKEWQSNLADRRYTSIVDVSMIDLVERRVRGYQSELQVRYARDVRPNDLKNGSAILLGASEANPWVELYERNMNFVFHNDYKARVFSVINRNPKPGEPRQWDSAWNDPQRRVYCLVAYVPNLAGSGNAIILEGTSMSGTEGAWDFISDDGQLLPFLHSIQRPDGTIPHFELLLGNHNINASAGQSNPLGWRVID
jgi:hypothetical protein